MNEYLVTVKHGTVNPFDGLKEKTTIYSNLLKEDAEGDEYLVSGPKWWVMEPWFQLSELVLEFQDVLSK